jgi:hypothetical protein
VFFSHRMCLSAPFCRAYGMMSAISEACEVLLLLINGFR